MNLDDLIADVERGKAVAYAVAFEEGAPLVGGRYDVLFSERARRLARVILDEGRSPPGIGYCVLFSRDPADVVEHLLGGDLAVLVYAELSPHHLRRLKLRRVA